MSGCAEDTPVVTLIPGSVEQRGQVFRTSHGDPPFCRFPSPPLPAPSPHAPMSHAHPLSQLQLAWLVLLLLCQTLQVAVLVACLQQLARTSSAAGLQLLMSCTKKLSSAFVAACILPHCHGHIAKLPAAGLGQLQPTSSSVIHQCSGVTSLQLKLL